MIFTVSHRVFGGLLLFILRALESLGCFQPELTPNVDDFGHKGLKSSLVSPLKEQQFALNL